MLMPSLFMLVYICVQLVLLENVRFYKEEEKNNADFAKQVRTQRLCTWHARVRPQQGMRSSPPSATHPSVSTVSSTPLPNSKHEHAADPHPPCPPPSPPRSWPPTPTCT